MGVEEPFAAGAQSAPGPRRRRSRRPRQPVCEAEGIDVIPDETIPGVERAYVADPFGNRLELRQA